MRISIDFIAKSKHYDAWNVVYKVYLSVEGKTKYCQNKSKCLMATPGGCNLCGGIEKNLIKKVFFVQINELNGIFTCKKIKTKKR